MRRVVAFALTAILLCACGDEKKPAGAEGTATPTEAVSLHYATAEALRSTVREKELNTDNWDDFLAFTEVEDDKEIGEEKSIQYRELYVLSTANYALEVSADFSAVFSYTGDWILYYRNPDDNGILFTVPAEPADYSGEKEILGLYDGAGEGILDRVYTMGGVDTIYNEGHAVVEEIREITSTRLESVRGSVRYCVVPEELWNGSGERYLIGKGGGAVYRLYEDGRLFKSGDPSQEGEALEPEEGCSPFVTFLSLIE